MIAVPKLLPTDVMKIRAYITDWLASLVKGAPVSMAWKNSEAVWFPLQLRCTVLSGAPIVVIVFVCDCIAVFRLNSRSCPCSILFSVPLVQIRDCIRAPYHFPHLWFKFAFVSVLRIVFPIDLIRDPVRALYCFPRVVDKGFHWILTVHDQIDFNTLFVTSNFDKQKNIIIGKRAWKVNNATI